MNKITILHLSDIHFKKNIDEDNHAFRQTVHERLIDAVKRHINENGNPDFVAITGDVAFSGKKTEYDEALEFMNNLKAVLPNETEFLAVPGNHDVDRVQINKFFSLHTIVKDEKTDSFLESPNDIKSFINTKFKDYRDFMVRLNPGLYESEEDYFWVKNFKEKEVSFLGLNSAWACEGDDDRFNIELGFPQVKAALNKSKEFFSRVLLTHHPLNWLNEENLNRYSGEIFKNCKLILHGHTHLDNALGHISPSNSCIFLGANASYTKEKDKLIGFQFIDATFGADGLTVKVWPYRLDSRDRTRFVPDTHRWEKQDGPYFELSTVHSSSPSKGEKKSVSPLRIPEEYKKWIKEFHSILPVDQLAKKGEVVLIDLPAVYISLETANPFYKPKDVKEEEKDNETKELSTIDIEALMGRINLILLRGDAGMGKTTLIKHLAYSITQGSGPASLNEYLPVLIFLKDLWPLFKNSIKKDAEKIDFESLLKDYFEKQRCPLTPDIVLSYLEQNRALLLMDGLDEIPSEIRGDMVDMIHRFGFEHSENRFLITGRPHGVEGRAVHCFGKNLKDIEFLNEEKIGDFITRWFRAVSGQATGIAEMTAREMIADVQPHEHVAVFTRNPLLLTALCILYLVGNKRIPDQRADLYDRIVANLLYRRFHDPADTEKVNRVQEFLMNLAFIMQTRNIKSIEAYDAKEILKMNVLQSEGESLPLYKKRIEELFDGIEPVCGLLNRQSGGEIEFFHLSFQEFLAAKHMLDRDIDYKPYLKNGWWKETILLYTGLMNLEMKKKSNDIVREILETIAQPRIQLLGAKALRDFQSSRREEFVVSLAKEKLIPIIESKPSLGERFEAGEILGELGDPRIDVFNPPMVHVEAGEFIMGSNKYNREKPERRVYLDEFWMGVYPVTNAEFKVFIDDGGYRNEDYWAPEGWKWLEKEKITAPRLWRDRKWNGPNFPVVEVSWYEATAYTKWLSQKTGKSYNLPTEAQWEKTARGAEGLIYPWGNEFDKNLCNSIEGGLNRTSPVGIYNLGKSPYGCMDMAGNVREWSADWYEADYYKKGPLKNPHGPLSGPYRALRGGSWVGNADDLRCPARDCGIPINWDDSFGFRVARST